MIQTGKIVEQNRIEVDGSVYDFSTTQHYEVGDSFTVIKSLRGKIKLLEKNTVYLIDDVTLKKNLSMRFHMPITGVVNSLFGPRRNPTGLNEEFHDGVDITGDVGDPIWAAHDGKVIKTQKEQDDVKNRFGTHVIIEHENEFQTIYAHLDEIEVSEGDIVIAKQLIGTVGDTGKSAGPHLHLGMYYQGKELNPRVFLGKDLIVLGRKVFQGEEVG